MTEDCAECIESRKIIMELGEQLKEERALRQRWMDLAESFKVVIVEGMKK